MPFRKKYWFDFWSNLGAKEKEGCTAIAPQVAQSDSSVLSDVK